MSIDITTDIMSLADDLAAAHALSAVALVGNMSDEVLAAKTKQYTDAADVLRWALEDLSRHVKAPEDGRCWCGCPTGDTAFCVDCGRDMAKVRAGVWTSNLTEEK